MMTESASIPYQTTLLRAERLLVLAPHPDDEVIGCGGLVAAHLRERRKVRIVIATDGAAAEGANSDPETYRHTREEESRRGLALLGEPVGIDFLRFADRTLEGNRQQLTTTLRAIILEFSPDVIAVPSPIEIHPDHLALSRAFCELVQRDETLFADAATARVLFYEVSQPIRPNTIVDITDYAQDKFAALAAHESQLAIRDYVAFARGLNAYRAMTLPVTASFAEGYWVTDLPSLRTTAFSELQRAVSGAPAVVVTSEVTPVSIVVRTKDRPALLREALASIRANGYPHEIIVVNDGGASPGDIGEGKLIDHAESRGRAGAANAGARAATFPMLAFLDDDDLFHPEHLRTLHAAASQSPQRSGWYSDATSAFLRVGGSGTFETYSRQRLFSSDFDRDLLLLDNFIPLPTLLMRREAFLEEGGFDQSFELFEDWDFLIRLSARGDLVHVPVVTCEIRHFETGDSITLAAPEGSEAFRAAKLRIWNKHRARMTDAVIANAFERQKRRLAGFYSTLIEEKGRRHHGEIDVARLTRDKIILMEEMQQFDAAARRAESRVASLDPQVGELQRDRDRLNARIEELLQALDQQGRSREQERLENQQLLEAMNRNLRENKTTIDALYAELHRLQSLLDTIYGSRTWKLHTIVEKVKGRG